MGQFLKVFLSGIIYVLLSPIIVLGLALYFVYCVGVFIYMAIRCLIVFFSGGNPLGDLKEDVEAKKILKEREEALNRPMQTQINYYGPAPYPPYDAPTYEPEPQEDSSLEDENDEEVNL